MSRESPAPPFELVAHPARSDAARGCRSSRGRPPGGASPVQFHRAAVRLTMSRAPIAPGFALVVQPARRNARPQGCRLSREPPHRSVAGPIPSRTGDCDRLMVSHVQLARWRVAVTTQRTRARSRLSPTFREIGPQRVPRLALMTILGCGPAFPRARGAKERRRLTVSRSPWIPRPRRGKVETCPCREKEGYRGVRSTQAKPIRSTLQRSQWKPGTVEAQNSDAIGQSGGAP